jgi:hypothetical protein
LLIVIAILALLLFGVTREVLALRVHVPGGTSDAEAWILAVL